MLARSIASFAIAAGESIVSLANFVKNLSQIALWLKNTGCVLPPQEDAIFVGNTVVPHARAPGFCDRVTVIRPNPFIGYQSQRGRWISRDTPLLCILSVFRTILICPIMLQQNEELLKETT